MCIRDSLRGSNGIIAAGNPQCLPHNGIVVTGSESASFATKAENEASGSQLDATPNNCASKIGARALGLLNPGMVGTLQDVTLGSDICSGLCYSVCYGPQLQVQDTSASFTQWLDTAVSFDAASGNVIIDVWVNQPEGDKRIDVISFKQLPADNTLPTSTCNNLDGLAANLVPSSDDVTNQVDNNAKFVAAEGTPLAGTHWVAQTGQARDIKVGGVTQVSATGMKHYRGTLSLDAILACSAEEQVYFESNSGTPLAPGVSRLIRLPMYLFSFESSIQNGPTDYGTTTGVKLVAYWHNTLTFTTWSDGFLSAEANAMVSEVVAVDEEVLTLSSSANKDEYQVTLYTATPKKNGRHVRLYAPVYTSNSMKSSNPALVDCEGSNVPSGGACSYQFAILTNTVGFETCLADTDHEFSTVPAGQDAYTNAGYCLSLIHI